jgi:N6-adenosine-specific RNA methylase IME4/ParB-like chromosome segregation protein Spo0J
LRYARNNFLTLFVGETTHGFAAQDHPCSGVDGIVCHVIGELDALVADIAANGLSQAIVVLDNQILDGRNRYRACLKADVQHRVTPYRGKDPLAFVISANLHRRHLDESQRAMVAAKLATLRQGARTDLSPIGEMSQQQAADLLNIGKRSVERATEVRDHGAPELQRAVEQGKVSVSAAADVATLPEQEQTEIIARGKKEILETAKAIRAERARQRYEARVLRIAQTSAGNAALPDGQHYPLIYADPPWDYRLYNETTGSSRAAAEHYPTMKLDEICALPVFHLAADNAILFLWTTAPHLQESFQVLGAWGFEYKTGVVWAKDVIGLGHFVRGQHEHLLIATRGDFPCPLPANRPASVISAPRREHSRKPDEAYELIERMYPELPKIELFARQRRSGWEAWGNEATVRKVVDDAS